MRVVSVIATSILVVGLAACGHGGGLSDLNLPSTPTAAPVPTPPTAANVGSVASSSAPSPIPLPAVSLVARARVARLAVYDSPAATHPVRELTNPWLAV